MVKKHRLGLLLCQTFLLILFLNLTPAIIEGTARFATSYSNYRAVDYITQNGQIASNIMWVHNWPSFSILVSIFAQITAIPGQFILLLYPTIFNILLLVPLFVFFRSILDFRMTWIAVWFVFLGNWVGQDYFSMQSLAFLVFVLILFLIFKSMNQQMRGRQWGIVLFLLFFYIVSSHLLTSLAILCIVLVLYLSKYLARPALLFSFVAIVAGWAVFDAINYLSGNLVSNLKQALNLSTIFQSNVSNRLAAGGVSHVLASQVRVAYSVAIIAFAFLGIILLWRSKRIGTTEKRVLAILVSFSLLLLDFSYGGELFMRLYMFSLIPLAYFAAMAMLKYKSVLVVGILLFMVVAPSLIMIAHYGNEKIDYTPNSELQGANFLFSTTTQGNIYGSFNYVNYKSNYNFWSFGQVKSINSLWTEPIGPRQDNLICISYVATESYSFFSGNPEFIPDLRNNVTQSPFVNLVYSNPSFDLYVSQG